MKQARSKAVVSKAVRMIQRNNQLRMRSFKGIMTKREYILFVKEVARWN